MGEAIYKNNDCQTFYLHFLTTIVTMMKFISSLIGTLLFLMTIVHCQSWNDTDSIENVTEAVTAKPFVYYGRYHPRRFPRDSAYTDTTSELDTTATILSILPLDRLGAIIGQIMATGVKEMLNPNVGKKIVNVLENQGPSLLTSLFTNLYSTFRVPVRPSTSNTTVSINKMTNKQLSNSSTSPIINSMRRPGTK